MKSEELEIFEILKDKVIINKREFYYKKFQGKFPTLLKCKEIGHSAFENCIFTGDLNLPQCELISNFAFQNSKFDGKLILPKCKFIYSEAFFNSEFIGNLDLPQCVFIKDYALYNSRFSGILNIPKCKELHSNALKLSNFSEINIGSNAILDFDCIGKNSDQFIDSYNENNQKGGVYKWNGETWEYAII